GRTLRGRASRTTGRVYLFAHETLRVEAERLFRDDLPRYWQRIRSWAEEYRERGWPDDTPGYLLAPYGRQLAELGQTETLAAIAADPARQDGMYHTEHSDTAALAEILTSRTALITRCPPNIDLAALAKLAIAEQRLHDRNSNIPPALPLVWATLGDLDRAEQLARTITNSYQQAEALAGLARAVAGIDPDRAEQLARTITDPDRQARALAELAVAVAGTDPDRAGRLATTAEQIARTITNPHRQARALADLAGALAGSDPDRAGRLAPTAEQIARTITHPDRQPLALAGLAPALGGT